MIGCTRELNVILLLAYFKYIGVKLAVYKIQIYRQTWAGQARQGY